MGSGKSCTAAQRSSIFELHKAGKSYKEIGEQLKCSKKMVFNALQHITTYDTISNVPRRKRPRKTSAHTDRMISQISEADPNKSSTNIQHEIQEKMNVTLSRRTISRRLLENGLQGRAARKKSLLFSDETKINRIGPDEQSSGTPNYKRTTDKQYSLLKYKMAILPQQVTNDNQNNTETYKQDNVYLEELTEILNKLGPPYRNLQQWKKVWSDIRRSENKRKFKSEIEQNVKKEPKHDNKRDLGKEVEEEETCKPLYDIVTSREVNSNIKNELEDCKHDTQTMEPLFDNEYLYPDEQESYVDETNMLIPDESSCGSYTYSPPELKRRTQQTSFHLPLGIINYATPPPLQPSNVHVIDQTLCTLQNQMEHQTKLLEHLSQMSSIITGLMIRQMDAVEKQTEAIRRQASATEQHSLAINSFMDMMRKKMLKRNLQKTEASMGYHNIL